MNTTTFRRAAVAGGSLTAVAALALTCAAGAQAAPSAAALTGTQGTALAASLHLDPTALRTPQLFAAWAPGSPEVITKSANSSSVLPSQTLLTAGVAASSVVVRKKSAYSCSGLLGRGGTVQVGDGSVCKAVNPVAPGVKIDLSSLLSSLPVGVGGITITASAITASSVYVNGTSRGAGRVINAAVGVCLGATLNGACVGVPVSVPLKLSGATNEDVLPVITQALTASPQLKGLATTLTNLLRPVVAIRANAQGSSNQQRIVVGLQLSLLQRSAFANFAVAQSGPRVA